MKKLLLLLCLIFQISSFSNKVLLTSNDEYIIVANENVAKVYKIKSLENLKFDQNVYATYWLNHGSEITSVSITPDNKYVITGGGKYAKMWKLFNGSFMAKL